jgi:isopenicillin-N epimerase
MTEDAAQLHKHWQLDPGITFLNHGSFGACPSALLDKQRQLQDQIEREPVAFFMRDFEALMDQARDALGTFLNVDSEDLALISNATAGVNTVLRSLTFSPGDELLTTDHAYNACRNALEFIGKNAQARVVVAKVPFPLSDPEQAVTAIMDRVTDKTRLVLLDHITSPTGLILPAQRIVDLLRERGIDCLVDGAHAPGMIDLDLQALNPAYYTGNCHKWLCAPKGSAFLYVRRDLQTSARPMSISHGANSLRTDRSRYLLEFDWPGTMDPTAWLCIPDALKFLSGLFPDGWAGLRRHNRELVIAGRQLLCQVLGTEIPAPDSMIGSLASVELPPGDPSHVSNNPLTIDPLQDLLFHADRIEVPVMAWPQSPRRLLRVSAQAYNDLSQYEHLAASLRRHLGYSS